MKKAIVCFSAVLVIFAIAAPVLANGKTLLVDVRQRPPEMVINGEKYSGPLLDIIGEAAKNAGYKVKFNVRQFKASLARLKMGKTDVLPRTICTEKRARLIDYLGPIGYQEKTICFLVKPGREKTITSFEDLGNLKIGVKKGTVYFRKFDESSDIVKVESRDDDNMVKMFQKNRFDAMIILDRKALESALKKHHISEYSFAEFKHVIRIGNYFGIAPKHEAREKLQQELEKMTMSGRVRYLYEKYGAPPPAFDPELGFESCFPDL